MGKTYRNRRPKYKPSKDELNTNGTVRDGIIQYSSSSCKHHGSCGWCLRNRTFNSIKGELHSKEDMKVFNSKLTQEMEDATN